MKTKEQIIKIIENKPARSAWSKGVKNFALVLVEGCEGEITLENLLNGACDWKQYSEGGCYLVYNEDIAKALCTPSELKRTDNGRLNPNSRDTWIDVQSRALFQAWHMIRRAGNIKTIEKVAPVKREKWINALLT